jgi:agmatine/peptidylarginine deiminase
LILTLLNYVVVFRGVHFAFNNWGKPNANYERDRVAAWKLLNIEKKLRYHCPMILEGGSDPIKQPN